MDGLWTTLVWDLIDFILEQLTTVLEGIFGDHP